MRHLQLWTSILTAYVGFLLHENAVPLYVLGTEDVDDETCTSTSNFKNPPDCRLYLAESRSGADADGDGDGDGRKKKELGLFTGVSLPRRTPIGEGDLVIHLVDLPEVVTTSGGVFVERLVGGNVTGGHSEGYRVHACLPGVGMTAVDVTRVQAAAQHNGDAAKAYPKLKPNAIPFRPDIDEADLARTSSPGAGAITHYHNMSFYTTTDLVAGDEILRAFPGSAKGGATVPSKTTPPRRTVEDLRQHGVCVDGLRASRSRRKNVGRGAFSTRTVKAGERITSSPVLLLDRKDIAPTTAAGTKNVNPQPQQLIINYCFGHSNSTKLLYPNGPMVNLINHDSESPNAVVSWSKDGFDALVLDYVALTDIMPGQEITIDYGKEWEEAWAEHQKVWTSPPDAEEYAPSYVVEDVVSKIRTAEEQAVHPYASNVRTSCFYRYADNKETSQKEVNSQSEATTVRWKVTRGLFNYEHLRPCTILSRLDNVILKEGTDPQSLYTVLIRNAHGTPPEERIPKGTRHAVSHVPRYAIRFTDLPYSTDPHLSNSFRHSMGMPDGLFPLED